MSWPRRARRIRFARLLLVGAAAAIALLTISLVAVAAPGSGGSKASAPASAAGEAANARVVAQASRHSNRRHSNRGRRGPRGKRGARGGTGPAGAQGPIGPQGAQGQQGSPIIRQPISIGWQNNAWEGQATQEFVVPGIGRGNVTCRPPYNNGSTNREPGGTQWVQVFPNDSTGSYSEIEMWTTRHGGPPQDSFKSVVRTAKLLNLNDGASFYEGMNTKSDETVDPESQGMFTGIIVSRPKGGGVDLVPPTTFVLSWHWDFTSEGQNRCYVSGNFYTGR